VLATVQRHLDGAGAGIEMVTVRLLYVHRPEEVHGAFRDVASAQEDKLRTINPARTLAVEKVQPGRGETAAMVQEALAFRDEQILKARDEAVGFGLQADAYRAAPDLTTFRLQLEPQDRSAGRARRRAVRSMALGAARRGDAVMVAPRQRPGVSRQLVPRQDRPDTGYLGR
jgi:regulator of protease activity HflC (stomatin/prohibitin superfamily)